jgi:hypothetical protein
MNPFKMCEVQMLSIDSNKSKVLYLRVYKPHFFDKNLPPKIGVRLYTE